MGETKEKIEKLVGNDKVEDTIYNYTYILCIIQIFMIYYLHCNP